MHKHKYEMWTGSKWTQASGVCAHSLSSKIRNSDYPRAGCTIPEPHITPDAGGTLEPPKSYKINSSAVRPREHEKRCKASTAEEL